MLRFMRIRGRVPVILAALLLLNAGSAEARFQVIPKTKPKIDKVPDGCHGNCGGGGCHGGNCGGGTPPGTTHNAPEPASLLSGLIGLGLAGVYGARRKKKLLIAE